MCSFFKKLTRYRTIGKECECEPKNCLMPKWNASGCICTNGIRRSVLSINRMLPGPAIYVCQHDLIRVIVHNDLESTETSIHWHGILQRGTPYMDGISRITQCAINAGASFTYEYISIFLIFGLVSKGLFCFTNIMQKNLFYNQKFKR